MDLAVPKIDPQWMADLDARERAQIWHARAYARNWASAGAPGHGQFILLAKLAQKLDEFENREGEPGPSPAGDMP